MVEQKFSHLYKTPDYIIDYQDVERHPYADTLFYNGHRKANPATLIKALQLKHKHLFRWEEYAKIKNLKSLKSIFHPQDIYTESEKTFIVFDHFENNKIFEAPDTKWTEEDLWGKFIPQIFESLFNLHKNKICHRFLIPENIYIGKEQNIILGDFLSTSPGNHNFIIGETITNSICHSLGKSDIPEDDYYAVGVLCFTILFGQDQLDKISHNEEIIQGKIEQGSFDYLRTIFNGKINAKTETFLKMLLSDTQKPTYEHMTGYFSSAIQILDRSLKAAKLQKPFIVFGKEHHTLHSIISSLLSLENFENDFFEEKDRLLMWLHRVYNDPKKADLIDKTIKSTLKKDPLLLWNIIRILDPNYPFMFQGQNFYIRGIPEIIKDGIIGRKDYLWMMDFLNSTMFANEVKEDEKSSPNSFIKNIVPRMFMYLNSNNLGGGAERGVYALSPYMPCIGGIFEHYCLFDPKQILSLLDNKDFGFKESYLYDHHLNAYLSEKLNFPFDLIQNLNQEDPNMKKLAVVKILNRIQEISGGLYANLTNYLGEYLKPVCNMFKNLRLQKIKALEIDKLKKTGLIRDVLLIFEDQDLIKADNYGYKSARIRHRLTQKRIERIDSILAESRKRLINHQESSTSAIVFLSLIFCLVYFLWIVKQHI